MDSRVTGLSRLAAAGAIVIVAAGVAGCGSAGSSSGSTPKASSARLAQTPQQAIQLAASTSRAVNSFAATMDIKVNTSSGSSGPTTVNLAGTVIEQLHPSLQAEADYSTFSAAGHSLPGGLSEIITTNSVYIKMSVLTQMLHTNKQWIAIPFSSLSKATGVNLGALFGQLQTNSPLNQSQLLAGAQNVRTVGTGVVNGVPVTEYSGSVSMTAALAKLPASVRSSLAPEIEKAGIGSAQFTEWVDAQHHVRKMVVKETGSSMNETITTTVTSINQPVSIQVPSAGQTTTLPASVLNSAGV